MPVAEVFKPRVVKLLDLLESGNFKRFVQTITDAIPD